MAKLVLNDIDSLANTASAKQALNENFTDIEAAIENTLSRDGTTPNQMQADIDMNSNDLLNVQRVDAVEFYKNGVPFEQTVAYSNKLYQLLSGTGAQTEFTLLADPGSLGNLYVSVAGSDLKPGIDYNYDGTTITFVVAPAAGTDNIYIRYDVALATEDSVLRQDLATTSTAGKSSALVGFIQSYAGSRGQTVQDRLRSLPLNVTDFALLDGLTAPDPTGVEDATLAVQRAFDACPDGGTVWINGKFRCSSPITVADKIITVQGFGHQSSQLIFAGCNGIVYTTTELFTDTIVIAGVGIMADSLNAYTGLRVTLPVNVGSPYKNLILRDLVFMGTGATYSQSWAQAAELENCAVSSADNCLVVGASGVLGNGFLLKGYSVDFTFNQPKCFAVDRAIKKDGPAEGIVINQPTFVNVNRGVSLNEGAVSAAGVHCQINGGHINYYDIGVYANYHSQVQVDGTLMYSQGAAAQADVYLSFCDYCTVSGVTATVKDAAANVTFVKQLSCNRNMISDNSISERTVGIDWDAGCANNRARGNSNAAITRYIDSAPSSGNIYEGETYVAEATPTLAGGAATETFTIAVPANVFGSAPRFVDVVGVTFNASFRYNFASSSATSLSVTMLTIDGGILPAGAYTCRVLAQE